VFNGTRLVAQAQWRNENHSLNFPVFALPGLPLDWRVIIDGWQSVNNEMVAAGNPDGITKLRWVLAHVPVITPDYLQKLKNLGGGVNVLGGWRWLTGTATQNGPPFPRHPGERHTRRMSSDGMQISTMSPWINLYYVVTGRNARGDLINAGQTLSRNDAMRLYTTNTAGFSRRRTSSAPSRKASWRISFVLSADYFNASAVPDESIKDLRSVLTVVGGKVIYDDLDGGSRDYWKAGLP